MRYLRLIASWRVGNFEEVENTNDKKDRPKARRSFVKRETAQDFLIRFQNCFVVEMKRGSLNRVTKTIVGLN